MSACIVLTSSLLLTRIAEKQCVQRKHLGKEYRRKSLLSRNNELPMLETLKETQQSFKGCYLTSSLARPLSEDEPLQSFPSPRLSPLVSANHSLEIPKPTSLISMAA